MSHTQQPISHGDIRQRFEHLNEVRLNRAQQVMGGKQRRALDLLPLLLHINHAQLPGFIDSHTPCGIFQYQPNHDAIKAARQMAPSITATPSQANVDIDAIYLMGSSGSVAHSRQSDFDIWLCHRPGLSPEHIDALTKKTERLSKWAKQQGADVVFFVMTAEQFRNNQRPGLNGEDCGSTQHKLLLDEFYRTALLLAGKPPLWWFVSPDDEPRYSSIDQVADTLDFGAVADIPFSEYIGAGVWQMYKSIDSPYKSMIKILLTETYASQQGDSTPLSITFKRLIYNDQLHPDELDPYVMMYRRLERYLTTRGDEARLEFIRRCFYAKVAIPLAKLNRDAITQWRQQLLRNLVDQWGWGDYQLMALDERHQWTVERAIEEQQLLVTELHQSYELLCRLAAQRNAHHAINAKEFLILGHKLAAWFEQRDNKIGRLNATINRSESIEKLVISHSDHWHLKRPDEILPLYSCDSLYQLLCWVEANNLADPMTQFYLDASCGSITPQDVQLLRRHIKNLLSLLDEHVDDDDYADEESMQGALFIIDTHKHAIAEDKIVVSDRNDVLKFGGAQTNLLHEIDILFCSSWHSLYHYNFTGISSVIESLCFVLNHSIRLNRPLPRATFFSRSSYGSALVKRYQTIYQHLGTLLLNNAQTPRYIIEIEHEHFVLEKQHGDIQWRAFENRKQLFQHLAQERQVYSPIALDQGVLSDTPLPAMLPIFRPDIVQVFYQTNAGMAAVYINDERGALLTYYTHYHSPQALMQTLQRFLQNTRQRQLGTPTDLAVYFYDIQFHRKLDRYVIAPLQSHPNTDDKHHVDIRARGSRDENRRIVFDLYIENTAFLYREHGEAIFHHVAMHCLQNSQGSERYPCYVSDIDLSDCSLPTKALPTTAYLQHKQTIEQRINQALKACQ
ncbi:MAG: hypothetical protein RL336_173 [Pseudomonadota bacterium]